MSTTAGDARVFSGTVRLPHLPADSRGFAYGDGVFETMRASRGVITWWPAHWERLCAGAAALGMATPDPALVQRQIDELLAGDDAVVKWVVSRGAAGRGYTPSHAEPLWLLSRHPLPRTQPLIEARWCRTQLGVQPALAGIKHCNRLEQVLARAEWAQLANQGAGIEEGLMCSVEGDVVCATAGNLFVLDARGWRTPLIDRCGVRGICRAWAMAEVDAAEARLTPADIDAADAVFVCNAVRGILQVARLARRSWSPHREIDRLRERLALANPAFAAPRESP